MDAEQLKAEGWRQSATPGFVELIGPLWWRGDIEQREFAFLAEPRHGNRIGIVHGGMLMSFADNALGELAAGVLAGPRCATIQLQLQFAAAARIGDLVVCRPEIIRRSMTLIFLRGLLSARGKTLASAEGIWKVITHKPGARRVTF